jgi:copper chaperone CopZ
MTTRTYDVAGLTCDHCVQAVTEELATLEGVRRVAVRLDAGGTSAVLLESAVPLAPEYVVAALVRAGDYRLLGAP